MKKKLLTIIISLAAALCLCFGISACAKVVYKLNFIVDDEVYATIDTSGEEAITMPTNPTKEDYLFDGWYWDKGIWQRPFTADSLLHEKLTSDMSVYAKWLEEDVTKKSYTVTFNSMGGSSVEKASVVYNNLLTEPQKPTRTGYIFVGWYREADCSTKWGFAADTVTKDLTLYAKWVDETDAAGCDILVATGFSMQDKILSVKVPHAQEYFALSEAITVSSYATWTVSSDIGGNIVIPSATVSLNVGDNTYYINITSGNGSNKKQYTVNIRRREIYTVTYQLNNGDTDIVEQAEEDQKIENKQVEKTGYSFTEWQYQGAAWNFGQGIGESMTLTATWQANSYTVTFDSADGSAVDETTATYDAEFSFEVPTRKGYTFNGWKTADGTLLTDGDGKSKDVWKIADDTKLTADWAVIEYTITYHDVNDATNNNQTSYTVESSDITLSDAVKTGYNFLGWYNAQDGGERVYKITVADAENINLWAKWQATVYMATFKAGENEQHVTFTVEDETLDEPTVPEKNGYIGAWEDYEIEPHDLTIEAVYTPIEYPIHYLETKDAANPNQTTYNIETPTFLLEPLEKDGYIFDGWFEGDSEVDQVHVGTFGEKTFTAKWTARRYTITYQDEKGAENPNKTEYTIEDETYYLQNISVRGFSFTGWYENGEPIEKIEKGEYGDRTFTANWIPYALKNIVCNESKKAISVYDEITAELFEASCLDTDGQSVPVKATYVGQLKAGATIAVTLTAEVEGFASVRKTLTDIKVYGDPTLSVSDVNRGYVNLSEKIMEQNGQVELNNQLFGGSGEDSFGSATQIRVTAEGTFEAGKTVTIIIHSIDIVGNDTEQRIENVRVYGEPKITYDEEKHAIRAIDVLDAKLFSATAQDSFGENVTVDVALQHGSQTEGNTVIIHLTATDGKGNSAIIDIADVKVYGTPSISEPTRTAFKVDDEINVATLGLSAQDTYLQPLDISLSQSGRHQAGETMTYTAVVKDAAGNIATRRIAVKIYGLPTISVGRTDVKDTETIDASSLHATATDSFGQPLTVSVTMTDGTFIGGQIVHCTVRTTDVAGNVCVRENVAVKVYSQSDIALIYMSNSARAIKASSRGEEFEATAVDSFGEACTITLEAAPTYALTGGQTISLYIVATDAAGNIKKSDIISNIKVYDTPTLRPADQSKGYAMKETDDLQTLFLVEDSFGKQLEFTAIMNGSAIVGEEASITVTATDSVGNTLTQTVGVKVYGAPVITYDTSKLAITDTQNPESTDVLGAKATDSFGGELAVSVSLHSGSFAGGETVVYTLSATDKVGNRTTIETESIRVYSKDSITITYAQDVPGIKTTSKGEEFAASATDSFGEACSVQFSVVNQVVLVGGATVSVCFEATDKLGNVKIEVVEGVKVYDIPTLRLANVSRGYVMRLSEDVQTLFVVEDSFGVVIGYTAAPESALTAGETASIDVVATDVANNTLTQTVMIKVYDIPKITYTTVEAIRDTQDPISEGIFKPQATDSFGDAVPVTISLKMGSIVGGQTVVYLLSATDVAGNTATVDTEPTKVYSKEDINITYLTVKGIKTTSEGEEFAASATDSFGGACSVQFGVVENAPLDGGTIVSVFFEATDKLGNSKKEIVENVKVFDMPTLRLVDESKPPYITREADLQDLYLVTDSFGNDLVYTAIPIDRIVAGRVINVTIEAVDDAGNRFSQEVQVSSLGDSMALVELYVDGEYWQSLIVDKCNYTLPTPEKYQTSRFVSWEDECGVDYADHTNIVLKSLPEYLKLYANTRLALIGSVAELSSIDMIGAYKLTCDLDLGGAEWTPLGTEDAPFRGVFDGNGHKITNFQITTPTQYVGLFGKNSGAIRNLGVENFTIDISGSIAVYAGGLVGSNSMGDISGCYAVGTVKVNVAASVVAGGLVGRSEYSGIIENCYAAVKVTATATGYKASAYAGGFVGTTNGGMIQYCYATGNVSATSTQHETYAYAGGFVGDGTKISYSFATGDVTAVLSYYSQTTSAYAGAFTGDNYLGLGSGHDKMTTCYYSAEQNVTSRESSYGGDKIDAGTKASLEDLQSEAFLTRNLRFKPETWNFGSGFPTLKFGPKAPVIYINNKQQLTELQGQTLSGDYVLTENIDLENMEWTPIVANTGIFFGNGHIITNFKISSTVRYNQYYDCAGMFGSNSGLIFDLGVENFTIDLSDSGTTYVGGLVGSNEYGIVCNCHSIGNLTISSSSSTLYAGGLVGYNSSGVVIECYAMGNVTVTSSSYIDAGGLVGYSGTIINSYAVENVTAVSSTPNFPSVYIGGLAGYGNKINNCYATGNVCATSSGGAEIYVGGLVGYLSTTINNCYATGNVNATAAAYYAYAGGLVGYNKGTIKNCFATGNVSATVTSPAYYAHAGGLVGVSKTETRCYCLEDQQVTAERDSESLTPNNYGTKTTLENLQSEAFLTDTLQWDPEIWVFGNGFPTLSWQNS